MQFHIIKEVRDIRRFNHILLVLFEEGFGFLLNKLDLKHHIPVIKRLKKNSKETEKPEVMLRKTLERLGPAFIKFGQLLSVRPDLIPKEYCKELEKLQDKVPPFSYEEAKAVIEGELKKNINEVFSHFEKKPVASASISQVYRAVLKSGEIVAIKVQRPDARKTVETDIEIMEYFARVLSDKIENVRRFNPIRIVSEFKEWTEKELDFKIEARNAQRFYKNFFNSKTVKIPKIYEQHSTEKVLVMEFIDGIELHDIKRIRQQKIDFIKIINYGFDAVMTQILVHGIFHADPHPGNILVTKDNKVAFIDFGIVGYFDERLKNKSIDFLYGIMTSDEDLIIDTLVSMGMDNKDFNYEELRADISYAISPLQSSSVEDVKISRVFEDIFSLAVRHKFKVPQPLVLFGKTLVTLEGIALEYDPKFRLIESTEPMMKKIMLKRMNPLNRFKSLMHTSSRYRRMIEELPERAESVMDRIEKGSIKVDIEDTDIKKLSVELDRSSNRISYGMLIAALLVTSAILIQVERGPHILGVPWLSFVSFAFASFFLVVLFVSIIREKFRH
ncbi:MAG TPA: AarF/ABC1/UbiB kinase family protein [Candidatus Nanoarchaeia archaeon]|nr:AarF/ABC1/UbiB kinase family protein [Candidatus Nanoarchaeia archaeon]